jgi:CHASE2 domain-containing sensor protein
MKKLLILELDGTFEQGFKAKLEIRKDIHARPQTLVRAQLPANLGLLDAYRQWQRHYSELEGFFRILKDTNPDQVTRSSDKKNAIAACREMAISVENTLNDWLNLSQEFEPIRKALIGAGRDFCLWLQTDSVWLQRLPLEKWDLLQEAEANLAVIVSEYEILERNYHPNQTIRILAIFGEATDLKSLEEDQQVLLEIAGQAGADIVCKKAPKPQELNELLREGNWDILFFSGHSASTEDGKRYEIQLTEQDKLEIPDFRYALKDATAKGLKLAIFNSCDGIGLAHQLAAEKGIVLPHLIFMREKLPDPVSPKFLKPFLASFTANKSLYTAVRDAQNILHDDWDKKYPCASWLPIICPNPTEEPPTWDSLSLEAKQRREKQEKQLRKRWFYTAVLVSFGIAAGIVGIRELGGLENLELNIYDQGMRLKPKDQPDERFLIVTIDQEDKDYQDQKQWKRAKIATTNQKRSLAGEALSKLLTKLQLGKPSVIALDILRPIAAHEDYPLLAEQLKTTPGFITICKFNDVGQSNGFPPPPELPQSQVGFSNVTEDKTGNSTIPMIRRNLYQAKLDKSSPCLPSSSFDSPSSIICNFKDYAPSFSLAIAKRYLELQNKDFDCNQLNQGTLEINIGDARVSDWLQSATGPYKSLSKTVQAGRQVMLNYRRMADDGVDAITKIAPTKSLRQVLDPSFNLNSVNGKIVLIGVIQPGVDDFLTPFSRNDHEAIPGVYLHGHAVSQILDTMLGQRVSIRFWTPWQEALWIFGWSIAGGVLAWRFVKIKYVIVANIIVLVLLSGICWILLSWGGLWLPWVPPVLGIVVTSGSFWLIRFYFTYRFWYSSKNPGDVLNT